MRKKYLRLKKFLGYDIWTIDVESYPKYKRFFYRTLKTAVLGIKSFREDKLNIRASALTYFSILSIIPVLALGFGIAKGFGLEKMLEKELSNALSGQEEVISYILKFTHSALETTKGGIIAGIGLVLLVWSVMKLLTSIESSFNTVWEVKKSRSWVRKFTDYLSIMLFSPILIILSSSISIFISAQLNTVSGGSFFGFVSPILLQIAKIIPFIIIWILFTLLYIVIPNTKVEFKSALIAGIIAGTVFQIFQWAYIYFQSGATRLSAIYGSFAALPLFLIWMQTSWFVVLIGAEISFAAQSVKSKGVGFEDEKLSFAYRKKLAVLISYIIIKRFEEGEPPATTDQISDKLHIPNHTARFILNFLLESKIVSEVIIKGKKTGFQPAESVNNISLRKINSGMEKSGIDNIQFLNKELVKKIQESIKDDSLNEHGFMNKKLVKDL